MTNFSGQPRGLQRRNELCLNTGKIMESKAERYSALVVSRKACNRCAALGLTNPVSIRSGAFDSNEIGPWTCWNGDLDARILVVGQEWGDVDSFERQKGRDDPSGTNRMLRELLAFAGFNIDPAPIKVSASGVFLTNAALCLKSGGVQAPVKDEWFKNCGVSFLRAQVEIVDPRVVVALGQQAYRAVCYAFGITHGSFRDVVNRHEPIPLPTGASLVPVYHCGQRILNTHRVRDDQFEDWKLVKSLAQEGNRDAARGISPDAKQ